MLVSAEPEPARSLGTTDMTASVAGGITLPMPAPCTKKITPSTQIGVLVPSSWYPASAMVTVSSPLAATALVPNRRTSLALRGAISIWPAANGSVSRPASSGV